MNAKNSNNLNSKAFSEEMKTTSSLKISTSNASNGSKYNGIIKSSLYKTIRLDLEHLFTYVYNSSPSFSIVHNIVSIIRILQFIAPALSLYDKAVWPPNDIVGETMNWVSILFQFCPSAFIETGRLYLFIIFICIMVLMFSLIIYSSFYYKKNAYLPNIISMIISLSMASFAHILHPVISVLIFQLISQYIFSARSPFMYNIALIIISCILICCLIFLILRIAGRTISFRPISLSTISLTTWNIQFFSPIILGVLSGLASCTSDVIGLTIMAIVGIIYAFLAYLPFFRGGFISPTIECAIFTSDIVGALFPFLGILLLLIGKSMNLEILFCVVAFYIIMFVCSKIIFRNFKLKTLFKIDSIADDKELFPVLMKTPNQALNAIKIGFEFAHPCLVNWEFLRLAVNQWPKNAEIYYAYAKFVAIYPEESQYLEFIYGMLFMNKVKGTVAQCIKHECVSLMKTREANLSVSLKTHINKIIKNTDHAKHKLRNVWDIVLQGNTSEVETTTKRTVGAIDQVEVQYQRLLRDYPNNRFITRNYSHFLADLKGDKEKALEVMNKTRLLHRGVTVNEDQYHHFGLLVFDKLPVTLNAQKKKTESTISEESGVSIEETIEEQTQMDENFSTLKERIESIRIPATTFSIVIRWLFLIICFIVPAIAVIISYLSFVEGLEAPLEYIKTIIRIRNRDTQIAASSIRYIYSVLGFFDPIPAQNYDPPASLGSSWDLKEQIAYISSLCSTNIQEMGSFRTLETDNKYMNAVHSVTFTSSINYSIYSNINTFTSEMMSFQGVSVDFIVQSSIIVSNPITYSITNTAQVLNLVANTNKILIILEETLSNMTEYYSEIDTNSQKSMMIVMCVMIVFYVLANSLVLFMQIKWIQSNKLSAYECLTSFPKNAVSQLAESLRVFKNEGSTSGTTDRSEMNKQEENILKVLISGGNSSVKNEDMIGSVLVTILLLACQIMLVVMASQSVTSQTNVMLNSAPHYINTGGAYSMIHASLFYSDLFLLTFDPLSNIPIFTNYEYIDNVYLLSEMAEKYYKDLRYGNNDIVPYLGFKNSLLKAKEGIACDDPLQYAYNYLDVTICYDVDLIFTSIPSYISYVIYPFLYKNKVLSTKHPTNKNIWSMLTYQLYDQFFFPMLDEIGNTISNTLNVQTSQILIVIIIIICISIVLEIMVTLFIKKIDNHIRSVFRLMLHFPTDVVLSNPRIMKTISGNFSQGKSGSAANFEQYFDRILENLPEMILYGNPIGYVESMNKQCMQMFPDEEIIGKQTMRSFLSRFEGNIDNFFKDSASIAAQAVTTSAATAATIVPSATKASSTSYEMTLASSGGNASMASFSQTSKTMNQTSYQLNSPNGNISSNTTETLTITKDNVLYYYKAFALMCNQKLVITLRDITAEVKYSNLIQEERAKSDKMLQTILPPSLVKRVQNGETNISFSVQSATIIFMDIVSFTPWCGSLPAEKVMSTLNLLFKKNDALAAKYSSIMKIKCIGDCYMAAGGIFSEINQPAEHSKDVVNFGLDSLQAVKELNSEVNESLQIRVGINTGGPIVAGVLGVGKPTFEIIGPAINMAQQMEHHGVPSKVHISRNVYELVYGDNFIIKERGSIEIKGGSAITYLIEARK